jgi:tetratricopeptide (TPR) repeat protein
VAYVVLDQHRPAAIDALRRTLAERLPDYMLPNAFVPLDALPLNANGKVDRLALPAPELDRSATGRAYVAPSNPLEENLAELWQEILMLNEPPGVHDDFFDLGGHSLLSAHLVSRIEGDMGLDLNLVQFFSDPTIAGIAQTLEQAQTSLPDSKSPSPSKPAERTPLAAWSHAAELHAKILSFSGSWRGERAATESLVVGRNTSGTRPPLFWVFQGQHEMRPLATYLGDDQPLYGMRSGHLVMEYTEDNIQALAIGYAREIEALCPEGPLFLGGNCQGSRLALAIAQHLVRRTRHVPSLFLMEWTYLPQPYSGPITFVFGHESDRANPYVLFRYPELTWRCAFTDFRVEIVPGSHGQFFREPNIQALAQVLQGRMAESLIQPPLMLPSEARRAEIQVLNPPSEIAQESRYLLNVLVANPTQVAWPSGQSSGLMVANRWLSAKGEYLRELDACVPLPPLAPGESRSVNLPILTPAVCETAQLVITVTQEGVSARYGGLGGQRVPFNLIESPKAPPSPEPSLVDRYGTPVLFLAESDTAGRKVASLVRAYGGFILDDPVQSDLTSISDTVWFRRLLPYWNKALPDVVRGTIIDELGEWLAAAFTSREGVRESKAWGWFHPANALLLPILLDFWPQLKVIQILCDAGEAPAPKETDIADMLAPVVLNREELVLALEERSARIWKHLRSAFAANAGRLMPSNLLQLQFDKLSNDPDASLAPILKFLGQAEDVPERIFPAKRVQVSPHGKHLPVVETLSPINPEQQVPPRPSGQGTEAPAPIPNVNSGAAPTELISLGEEAWRRGDFLSAIDTLGAAAKSTDGILPKLAHALLKKRHYDQALLRFRQALISDENNAKLWLGSARARTGLGQHTEAVSDLKQSLRLGSAQPTLVLEALEALRTLKEEVLTPIRSSIEQYPDDVGLLNLAVQIEIESGNRAEASAKAQRLYELAPHRIDFFSPTLKRMIGRRWLTEAQALLEPLAQDMSGDARVQHLGGLWEAKRAHVLIQKGDYGQALTCFSQALAFDEDNAELWLGRANTRVKLAQRTEAVEDFQQSLRLGSKQPEVMLNALKGLESLKEDVLTKARSAITRHPEHIELLALAARIELDSGNRSEALAGAQRLSELAPKRLDLLIPIIESLIQEQCHVEARSLVEPLARDMPDSPDLKRLVCSFETNAKKVQESNAETVLTLDPPCHLSPTSSLWQRVSQLGMNILRMIHRV